jgi:hypothetical protein
MGLFTVLTAVASTGWGAETSRYEVVHAIGDPAPAGVSGTIQTLWGEHLSREGNLVYEANILLESGDAAVDTIYRRVNGADELVFVEGQDAPGLSNTAIRWAQLLGASDGDIEVLMVGSLDGALVTPDEDSGLFLFSNAAGAGRLQPIAWAGQSVTVNGKPVTLGHVWGGAIGSRGHVVFDQQNGSYIFDGEPGTIPSPRLYPGMPLPEIEPNAELAWGGTLFPNSLPGWNRRVNYLGQIPAVVSYRIGRGRESSAVIVSSKSGIRVVCQVGPHQPIQFVYPASLSINDAGRVAFLARIIDSETGAPHSVILKEEAGNELKEVVRVGVEAPGSVEEALEGFTIIALSPTTVSINTTGEVTFQGAIANSDPRFSGENGYALFTETQSTTPNIRMVARERGPLGDLPNESWEVSEIRYVQALENGTLAVALNVNSPDFESHRTLWTEKRLNLYQPFPVGCPLAGRSSAPSPFIPAHIGSSAGWPTILNHSGGQDGGRRIATPDGEKIVAVMDGRMGRECPGAHPHAGIARASTVPADSRNERNRQREYSKGRLRV